MLFLATTAHLGLMGTLAPALGTAFVLGYATHRLGLSPIVGYLLAGIALGSHTPGVEIDAQTTAQLAELGVVLLMFGVGLQFHLEDLIAVRRVAIPGAVGATATAGALGTALGVALGWPPISGLVFGVGLGVASTVVLLRVLTDHGRVDTPEGHIAIGWLVVEDVVTVLVLVLLPPLAAAASGAGPADAGALGTELVVALGKLALLAVVVLVIGGRLVPGMLLHVARLRSRELFTLSVLATALVVAAVAASGFGASMALGAFLAGMVIGRSTVSHQAAADALPMRDAFAVLFFVSVGILFDPSYIVERPLLVLGALAIILVGKPLAAAGIVIALGWSTRTALTVAIGVAQIGEFSFILAESGRALGVLPLEGHGVLVAAALLSITINPLLFRLVEPIERALRRRPALWQWLNRRAEARAAALNSKMATRVAREEDGEVRALVVGHGPVGRTVTRLLREFAIRPVVVEMNPDTVAEIVAAGGLAIYGDATRAEVLRAAGVDRAAWLVVTLPDLTGRIPVIIAARDLNPRLHVITRARYVGERAMLAEIGVEAACYEEAEAAVGLARHVLEKVGADPARIATEVDRIRAALAID